jgi:hypothetical protein
MITIFALMVAAAFPPSAISEEKKETVEHEAGFYYTVKEGDTLWDLSQRFSDSPWIWPELWKENDQIPNPHLIYPGERIRIYHRDWIERVAGQEPAEAAVTVEETSAPAETVVEEVVEEAVTPEFIYNQIDAVGFLKEKPVEPLGTIFKSRADKAVFGQGDIVYIRTEKEGSLRVGKKYTVYRTMDPRQFTKDAGKYGIQHLLVGIVRITDLQPRYAIATIERSYDAFHLGDMLIPYEPRSPGISLRPSVPGLKGILIGGEEQQELIGPHMTAFIDKGGDDGVAVGQEYLLYYQESDRISALDKDPLLLAPINFGTLLVLHVEPESATVLVTSSKDSIPPGTKFRAPGE